MKAHNAHKAHYIKQYAHTVAAAMKNKWSARAYIDTYAGPGMCWVQDSGEFVLGSPLIALEASPNFSHHVFVDMDSRCTSALEQRLAGSGATIFTADSNARRVRPRPRVSQAPVRRVARGSRRRRSCSPA